VSTWATLVRVGLCLRPPASQMISNAAGPRRSVHVRSSGSLRCRCSRPPVDARFEHLARRTEAAQIRIFTPAWRFRIERHRSARRRCPVSQQHDRQPFAGVAVPIVTIVCCGESRRPTSRQAVNPFSFPGVRYLSAGASLLLEPLSESPFVGPQHAWAVAPIRKQP
jgi:hypothetical protein